MEGVSSEIWIGREDPRYKNERLGWNSLYQHSPAGIVKCRDANDVSQAIQFCVEKEKKFTVRGGGCSFGGYSSGDGAIVLDLRRINQISFDTSNGTLDIGGGAIWKEVDAVSQRFGRFAVGGAQSMIGVAGLVSIGGWGYSSREFGMACDNLISADVILHDGQLITVDSTSYPDLFWAIRGGQASQFCVILSLKLKTYEMPNLVKGGIKFYPIEIATDLLSRLTELMLDESTSEKLTTFGSLRWHGDQAVAMVSYLHTGDPEECDEELSPLFEKFEPLHEVGGVGAFSQHKLLFSGTVPDTQPNLFAKGNMVHSPLDPVTIDRLVDHTKLCPSRASRINFEYANGAIGRVKAHETAFAHRSDPIYLNFASLWSPGSGQDNENIYWAQNGISLTDEYNTGRVYPGYTDRTLANPALAYWGSNCERLREVKKFYDPQSIFEAFV